MKVLPLYACTIILSFVLSGAVTPQDPSVLDTNGQKLRFGTKYYILPLVRGNGGGVTLASNKGNNNTCMYDVVQEQMEVKRGTPVTFSRIGGNSDVVLLSTDITINFSPSKGQLKRNPLCSWNYFWNMSPLAQEINKTFVTAGGRALLWPEFSTDTGSPFKIVQSDGFYNMLFCPSCDFCRVVCRDIGIFVDGNGRRKLALSDSPFRVIFVKL